MPTCECGFDFVQGRLDGEKPDSYAVIPDGHYHRGIRDEYAILSEPCEERKRAKILDMASPSGGRPADVGLATWACWARRGRSVLCVRNAKELWEVAIPAGEEKRVYTME